MCTNKNNPRAFSWNFFIKLRPFMPFLLLIMFYVLYSRVCHKLFDNFPNLTSLSQFFFSKTRSRASYFFYHVYSIWNGLCGGRKCRNASKQTNASSVKIVCFGNSSVRKKCRWKNIQIIQNWKKNCLESEFGICFQIFGTKAIHHKTFASFIT